MKQSEISALEWDIHYMVDSLMISPGRCTRSLLNDFFYHLGLISFMNSLYVEIICVQPSFLLLDIVGIKVCGTYKMTNFDH